MKGHLKRYFITGLLVIIPIWGTYLVLSTLLKFLEGFLGDFLKNFDRFYVPGMGIASLIILIFLTGFFATNYIGRKVVSSWERLMTKVPLVRNVYTVIKHVVDTVSLQGKDQFRGVVLVEFPRKGTYSMGFVTGITKGEVQDITEEKVLNVFIPTTPNPTTGYFVFVPEGDVMQLSMSVEDGMKMIISGGLYTPANAGILEQIRKKDTNVKDKETFTSLPGHKG
ncbi:MAG TPA: hypothetical protein DDX84_05750 [Nitrospiraceae bacterium]|nr:hypothetical protein [Nitrospiraceae bacterium]